MIWCQKSNIIGGLTSSPNHSILILRVMKGHSETGQSQKSEGTAIANQLHKCHTSLFAQSQVLHKCLSESVAHLSRCLFVTPSFYRGVKCCKYVYANRCRYVTVANMSVKCCKYVLPNRCSNITLHKCHVNVANMFSDECCRNVTVTQKPHQNRHKCHSCTNTTDPLQWKMTPPVENESDPHQWKMTPPRELETTSGNNP